jgi:hypothetical protein
MTICCLNLPVLPLPAVCSAQSLEILDLSYNRLSGLLPDAFAAMGSLRELLLDVNQFDGPLPDAWASLPNLQRIFLSENRLTGQLPEAWGDLKGLADLWVEYNKVRSNGSRSPCHRNAHEPNTYGPSLAVPPGGISIAACTCAATAAVQR